MESSYHGAKNSMLARDREGGQLWLVETVDGREERMDLQG